MGWDREQLLVSGPPPRAWAAAEDREIVGLRRDGASIAETARGMGVSASAVQRRLIKLGVRGRIKHWTPAQVAVAIEMRRAAATATEIGAATEIGWQAARKRLIRLGEWHGDARWPSVYECLRAHHDLAAAHSACSDGRECWACRAIAGGRISD